jgi:hypothetical protein
MLNAVITVKAGMAILVLAVTAIISSFITISMVKVPATVSCPPAMTSPMPESQTVKKRFSHEIKLNTKDGTRY